MRFISRFLLSLFVILFLPFKSVASDVKKSVMPADVFVVVQTLNQDLENLRRHMGVPKANLMDIRINKVATHDVYFQARTMFKKVNRLSFEIIRQQNSSSYIPDKDILPSDVLVIVKRAHKAIDKVVKDFKINNSHFNTEYDSSKTPSDVFKLIMSTNRQLNQLLERPFSPSDVYIETMLAIGYAARLLSKYPGVKRIPDAPAFESEKKPIDVYFRLLNCLETISQIYQKAGFKTLDIDTSHIGRQTITPSDVFDVASLIVARLDFLHKKMRIKTKPRKVNYPGRKYPSDVYQYVGILEAQLGQILLSIDKSELHFSKE